MTIEPIVTRVAHTGTHELRFRGHGVFAQLLGKTTFGQMLVLGVGGRLLDKNEMTIIDDIVTVMSSADPRLWPFKVTRLAASYGRASAGVAATLAAGEGGMYGSDRVFAIASWLAGLGQRADPESFTDDQMQQELLKKPPGFGVVYRSSDERFAALMRHLEHHRHRAGHHLQLLQQAVRVGRERLRLEPHIYLAVAALCLDLGLSSQTAMMIGVLVLFHDAIANAAEGAEQRPASLQNVGVGQVTFCGSAPRMSPRAQSTSGGSPRATE